MLACKLFDITREWLNVHNIQDVQYVLTLTQKNKFYTKKVYLPYSTFTTFNMVLKSLPDAPEVLRAKVFEVSKILGR
jgi:hypothetical protein